MRRHAQPVIEHIFLGSVRQQIINFLLATLKEEKAGEIKFSNIFYLTLIKDIISTCNQYKNYQ